MQTLLCRDRVSSLFYFRVCCKEFATYSLFLAAKGFFLVCVCFSSCSLCCTARISSSIDSDASSNRTKAETMPPFAGGFRCKLFFCTMLCCPVFFHEEKGGLGRCAFFLKLILSELATSSIWVVTQGKSGDLCV